MAGAKLFGASNMSLLLQNETLPSSNHQVLESLWVHTSNPASFQGSKTIVDFENVGIGSRVVTDIPFFQQLEKEENCGDEDYEACFHQQGKKRRLSSEQVQFLERSFEVENKLEPDRKVQLAKDLGLQPRQVAIWFQNRRARFKTKQLEKDYGTLKASFDRLKDDYDNLVQENDKLKQEVNSLKRKVNPIDKENSEEAINKETMDLTSNENSENGSKVSFPNMVLRCKQEDANSAKSDLLDSDSPHCNDVNNLSSFMEPTTESSHVFEPDHSDFSQDEEDNDDLSDNLLTLPKIEDVCYNDPRENSCNFGFPVEDQTFCFWPYSI
ncbi:unnamed protein product [Lathyrus sativus]|nr:unnamed protein product [Lathyrus sativus]